MSAEDARRAARRAFGGVDQAKEYQRDARSFRWLDDLQRDARYALRSLGRSPAFTIAAVLTLAIGIGATTAIYSVVDTVLIQPLPLPNSDQLVRLSESRQRFYAVLLGIFAGVAGLLAAIGIYGVLAYSVVQRTQEIGIRMALGAERRQVMMLIMRRGVALASIGIVAGLIAAFAGARYPQSMLFGVEPRDPATYATVAAMFAAVALAAAFLPARRAIGVDPMAALRVE